MLNVKLPVMTLSLCLAACGSSLRVTAIQLGRAVNVDGSVANHTTTFGPDDTVYVSIATAGVGSGTMGVRWTYGDRVLGEPKKPVHFRDAAITEFHLQSTGGFPRGDYGVEVFLNDQSVGKRTFRVESQ